VVGAGTRFSTDETSGQIGEKRKNFAAAEFPANSRFAMRVDAVNLENVFRQIEANNHCGHGDVSVSDGGPAFDHRGESGGRPSHHVGTLGHYAELLKRITDSTFKEGEHAE
jgi:hypothetical protein